MANLVDDFIVGVMPAEHLALSNRRLAIRKVITEYEDILRANGAGVEESRSVVQQLRDRAAQEISRHSPNRIPTTTADFFGEVRDELSRRARVSIQPLKDGTFKVDVSIPSPLPHVAKDDFPSIEAAQAWIDSDLGNAIIRDIVDKHWKK
jgi:hypothetical protein